MPTYVYRCSHCRHQFEKRQRFSDPPIERCPNCRRKSVRKVLQPAPIQFKGSGWYITDSKGSGSSGSGKKTSKKKDSETGSKSESSESSESSAAPSASGDKE